MEFPVVVMGVVDKEVVVLVRGEDVCLRRTSVTEKIALLASMVGMMGLADVVTVGVVIVGAAVSIVSDSVVYRSSSSTSSCSSAFCSIRSTSLVYSSAELSLESSMASSTWGVGVTTAMGR